MDEKLIFALMEKFNGSCLAELDLADGTSRLVLRKDAAFARANANPAHAVSGAVHLGLSPAVEERAETGASKNGVPPAELITSPIVATYYASPGPDAPAYVSPGTKVKAGATLCILEAMKMMNHLEAEFDCEILSVKAASGDLVEYGQILFEVKRL
jgi:acetyl-CoA carboxylase biotin carboxyl carrier protein